MTAHPGQPGSYQIPFQTGESLHKALPPGEISQHSLAAGRWMLSPRATVPYVTVQIPQWGGHEYSWGQMIEIPAGSQGTVQNTSFHTGDAVFDGAGSGIGFTGIPPGTVTVPANWVGTAPGPFKSAVLDTRRARRAYMCVAAQELLLGPVIMVIHYLAQRRGNAFGPLTFAATIGVLNSLSVTVGYTNVIPLGIGSGQNREPAPGANSLPELRPMAMLDALYLTVDPGDALSASAPPFLDAYFLLEY